MSSTEEDAGTEQSWIVWDYLNNVYTQCKPFLPFLLFIVIYFLIVLFLQWNIYHAYDHTNPAFLIAVNNTTVFKLQ